MNFKRDTFIVFVFVCLMSRAWGYGQENEGSKDTTLRTGYEQFIDASLDDVLDQLAVQEKKSAQLQKEIEGYKLQIKNTKAELKEFYGKKIASLQKIINDQQETVQKALADLAQSREKIKVLSNQFDEKKRVIDDFQKDQDKLIQENTRLKAQIEDYKNHITKMAKQVSSLETKINESQKQVQEQRKQVQIAQEQLEKEVKQRAVQQREAAEFKVQLEQKQMRIHALEQQIEKQAAKFQENIDLLEEKVRSALKEKEYFSDLTKDYERKVRLLERKVASVEQDKVRLAEKLKTVDFQRRQFKKMKSKNTMLSNDVALLTQTIEEYKTSYAELTKTNDALLQQLKDKEKALIDLQVLTKEQAQEIQSSRAAYESIEKEFNAMQADYMKISDGTNSQAEKIKSLERALEKVKSEYSVLKKEYSEESQVKAQYEVTISKLRKDLEQQKKLMAEQKRIVLQLTEQIKDKNSETQKARTALSGLDHQLAQLKSELSKKDKSLQQLKEQLQASQRQETKLTEEKNQLQQTQDKIKTQCSVLQKELEAVKEEAKQKEEEFLALKEQEKQLQLSREAIKNEKITFQKKLDDVLSQQKETGKMVTSYIQEKEQLQRLLHDKDMKLQELQDLAAKLQRSEQVMSSQMSQYKNQLLRAEKTVEKLTEVNNMLTEKNDVYLKEIETMGSKVRELNLSGDTLRKELKQLSNIAEEYNHCKTRNQELEEQFALLTKEKESAVRKVQDVETALQKLQKANNNFQNEIVRVGNENRDLQLLQGKTQVALNAEREQNTLLRKQMKELENELVTLKSDIELCTGKVNKCESACVQKHADQIALFQTELDEYQRLLDDSLAKLREATVEKKTYANMVKKLEGEIAQMKK